MNGKMFVSLLVEEDQTVEILIYFPAYAGGLDPAEHLTDRQNEGWHIFRIIDTANHHGLIRISFLEHNDDLVPDARPEECTPGLSRPYLRNAQPAGTIGIHFAFAIPVELH